MQLRISCCRARPGNYRRTSWGGFQGSRYGKLWSLEEEEEEDEEDELARQQRWRAKPRKRSNTLLEDYFLGL